MKEKYFSIIALLIIPFFYNISICQNIDRLNIDGKEIHVGFRSFWAYDSIREIIIDEKEELSLSRPILINVWFPSKIRALHPHENFNSYFQHANGDSNTISKSYINYSQTNLLEYLIEDSTSVFNKKTLLNNETSICNNAEPINQNLPLVIYHQGFGSSYADNTLMCEYIASKGYIVVGSSFLKSNTASSYGVDGKQESVQDIFWIVDNIDSLVTDIAVDNSKVAIIGHSGGAQAALLAAASDNHHKINSIISLENTNEYHPLSNTMLWENFTEPVLKNKENMDVNILAMAGHSAYFHLFSTLSKAKITYVTFPKSVNHDDYISLGWVKKIIDNQPLDTLDHNWRYVNEFIVNFLDTNLKGVENKPLDVNVNDWSAPKVFTDDLQPSSQVQTSYGLWQLYLSSVDSALSALKKIGDNSPLMDANLGFGITYDLLARGNIEKAVVVYNFYRQRSTHIDSKYIFYSRMANLLGKKKEARAFLNYLLKVNPTNETAQKLIESY